jgi:hypothetical protein
MESGDIAYRIDASDRIAWCNAAWDDFAAQNDAIELRAEEVRHRSVWDFISDVSTRELYREIFARVRDGRTIRVPIRCDAPECRRWMDLELRAGSGGDIEVRAVLLRDESRLHESLLDVTAARDGRQLCVCGWCKRMDVDGDWVEVEKAVDRLGLFGYPTLPLISHGICEECAREIHGSIEPRR